MAILVSLMTVAQLERQVQHFDRADRALVRLGIERHCLLSQQISGMMFVFCGFPIALIVALGGASIGYVLPLSPVIGFGGRGAPYKI